MDVPGKTSCNINLREAEVHIYREFISKVSKGKYVALDAIIAKVYNNHARSFRIFKLQGLFIKSYYRL